MRLMIPLSAECALIQREMEVDRTLLTSIWILFGASVVAGAAGWVMYFRLLKGSKSRGENVLLN